MLADERRCQVGALQHRHGWVGGVLRVLSWLLQPCRGTRCRKPPRTKAPQLGASMNIALDTIIAP
jgi:hypothetical protein